MFQVNVQFYVFTHCTFLLQSCRPKRTRVRTKLKKEKILNPLLVSNFSNNTQFVQIQLQSIVAAKYCSFENLEREIFSKLSKRGKEFYSVFNRNVESISLEKRKTFFFFLILHRSKVQLNKPELLNSRNIEVFTYSKKKWRSYFYQHQNKNDQKQLK